MNERLKSPDTPCWANLLVWCFEISRCVRFYWLLLICYQRCYQSRELCAAGVSLWGRFIMLTPANKFNINSTFWQQEEMKTRLDKTFPNERKIFQVHNFKTEQHCLDVCCVCVCVFNLAADHCVSTCSIIKTFSGIFTQQQGCQSVNPAVHPASRSCLPT